MTKPLKGHIFISSNLLSTAVNGAHVKMADLRRWASLNIGKLNFFCFVLFCFLVVTHSLFTQIPLFF